MVYTSFRGDNMERSIILRKLMEEKNMKVADVVRLTGIAYSTIKSMLENGVEKTGYANVCKVCEALGITTDQLEIMVKENGPELHKPTYEDIQGLVARNGKQMTTEQKMRLIQLLSEIQ